MYSSTFTILYGRKNFNIRLTYLPFRSTCRSSTEMDKASFILPLRRRYLLCKMAASVLTPKPGPSICGHTWSGLMERPMMPVMLTSPGSSGSIPRLVVIGQCPPRLSNQQLSRRTTSRSPSTSRKHTLLSSVTGWMASSHLCLRTISAVYHLIKLLHRTPRSRVALCNYSGLLETCQNTRT